MQLQRLGAQVFKILATSKFVNYLEGINRLPPVCKPLTPAEWPRRRTWFGAVVRLLFQIPLWLQTNLTRKPGQTGVALEHFQFKSFYVFCITPWTNRSSLPRYRATRKIQTTRISHLRSRRHLPRVSHSPVYWPALILSFSEQPIEVYDALTTVSILTQTAGHLLVRQSDEGRF